MVDVTIGTGLETFIENTKSPISKYLDQLNGRSALHQKTFELNGLYCTLLFYF